MEQTYVIVHTHVGEPLVGATITAFGPRGKELPVKGFSDRAGFEVLAIPKGLSRIRIVATGGTVGGQAFTGALKAVVAEPGTDKDAYLNPVSSVAAAWAGRHGDASLDTALTKARTVLGLAPGADVGKLLAHAGGAVDGTAFLRAANREGGFSALVSRLARRIDNGKGPLRFAAPADNGIADIFSALATPVSVLSGVGSIVNDIIGWAQGPQPTNGQIYSVVQQTQQQVQAIEAQISTLQTIVESDFNIVISNQDRTGFDADYKPLKLLSSQIINANQYVQNIVNNATSVDATGASDFSQAVFDRQMTLLESAVGNIENSFTTTNSAFRDAILDDGADWSGYRWLSNLLRDNHTPFFTPADSTALSNFANFVLQYQALGLTAIVRWEVSSACAGKKSCTPPPGTADTWVVPQLGTAAQYTAWVKQVNAGSTTVLPAAGNVRDELTFLQSIDAVPAGTVIDTRSNLMLQSGGQAMLSFPNATTCNSGSDSGIAGNPQGGNFKICDELTSVRGQTASLVPPALAAIGTSTGLSGWGLISSAQMAAFVAGQANPQSWSFTQSGQVFLFPNYVWLSDVASFGYRAYDEDDSFSRCSYSTSSPIYSYSCGDYFTSYIDTWNYSFTDALTGQTIGCSQHVGSSPAVTSCGAWLQPVRALGAGERYWF